MIIKQETIDISGMGGGYEDTCQRMLWRGVAHLLEMAPPPEMWKGAIAYEGIYGVLKIQGDDLKALEKAVIPPGTDCTGAMHQAVMSHLAYIHQHSTKEWLEEAPKQGGRMYEWEGALEEAIA